MNDFILFLRAYFATSIPCGGRRALTIAFLATSLLGFAALLGSSSAWAQPPAKKATPSLDEQVQEIKSDVLSIAAELSNLEERLLYPSNTQVAVFVSLAEGASMRLDSMRVSIDGELVAHHIYSWKELEALQKGGVQRIHTGNIRTGEHRIEIVVAGETSGGKSIESRQEFGFRKEVDPKLVGIELSSQMSGDVSIALGGW